MNQIARSRSAVRTCSTPSAARKPPDWSIGRIQNLLDELRFAKRVSDNVFGGALSPMMLTEMVTTQAAKVLDLDPILGSIAVGKKADLFVIGGSPSAPFDALLAARPKDVRLVMVNGVILYGDPQLQPAAPASPGCETLDVCGASKFVCVARSDGTTTNKLGQTLAQSESILERSWKSTMRSTTAWDFAPNEPLVKCD